MRVHVRHVHSQTLQCSVATFFPALWHGIHMHAGLPTSASSCNLIVHSNLSAGYYSTSGTRWIGIPFWFLAMISRASGTCEMWSMKPVYE